MSRARSVRGSLLSVALLGLASGSRPKVDLEAFRTGVLGKAGFLGLEEASWRPDREDGWPSLHSAGGGAGLAAGRVPLGVETVRPIVIRKRTSIYQWSPPGRCAARPEDSPAVLAAGLAFAGRSGGAAAVRPASLLERSAADSRRALAATLEALLPQLCGGPRAYFDPCRPDSVCHFQGVQCLGAGTPTALQLNCTEMGISGTRPRRRIPAAIGYITFLMALEFVECPFEGPLPPEVGNLSMLEALTAVRMRLGGGVPIELQRLKELRMLALEGTNLTGRIPAQLGRLGKLQFLSLHGNALTGSVPIELWDLQALEHLDLSSNALTGPLSGEIRRLRELTFLDVQKNALEGGLPPELYTLTRLRWLDLSCNGFTGGISPDIGGLEALAMLDGMENKFRGHLPWTLAKLKNLGTLDLSRNYLHGPLPWELGILPRIKWLDLHDNWFMGEVPAEYGNLTGLDILDLDANELEGSIPPSLGNLRGILYLGLGDNYFTGFVPKTLGHLENALVVNLADNELDGTIPPDFKGMKSLVGLFLYKNHLRGRIPPELAELPHLAFLALHQNSLYDRVPPLRLRPCQSEACSDSLLLTLYGNHLSCELPTPIDMKDRKRLKAAIVQGNKFSLEPGEEPPAWLTHESDPVHFERSGGILKISMTVAAATLVWLVFVLAILRTRLRSFVRQVLKEAREDEPEATAHMEVLALVLCLFLLSVIVLLPTCICGSRFTECGNELARLSITYLARSPLSEGIAGSVMILQFALVLSWLSTLPTDPARWDFARQGTMIIRHIPWLPVTLLASGPPVLFALSRVLPWDNSIKNTIGTMAYTVLFYGTSWVSAIVQILIIPRLAERYAKMMGVSQRQLLTISHFVCMGAAPMMTVAFYGENCGKRWRHYWSACEGDDDDFRADFTLWGKTIEVMSKDSMCRVPSLGQIMAARNGGCSRDILEAISPLVLHQRAIEAVVSPILQLAILCLCRLSEDGEELMLCGVRMGNTLEDWLSKLEIWAVTSAFWGAFVPLFQPILLLAVCVSYVMLRLERDLFCQPLSEGREAAAEGSGAKVPSEVVRATTRRRPPSPEDAHVSKDILFLALLCTLGFLALFVFELFRYKEV